MVEDGVYTGFLVDEGLESSDGFYVNGAFPLDLARGVALLLLFRPETANEPTIYRTYVCEKVARAFQATEWWHCIQLLHPSLYPAFVDICRRTAA